MEKPGVDDERVDTKAMEALLVRELEQMSFADREMMNEEIHGVRTLAPKETPEMLEEGLRQLAIELDALVATPCYDEAVRMSSTYVHDRLFKLRFLRAEMFDARKAAVRLENYLAFYKEHFGKEALIRPIYMTDLDKADQQILKKGNLQLLPCRDRSGRRIMSRVGDIGDTIHSTRSTTRVILYVLQVLSEDEDTQRKGAVFIFATLPDRLAIYSNEKSRMIHAILVCQPLRWSSFHICLPSTPVFQAFKGIVFYVFGKDLRTRARFHDGSPLEWQYSLSSYGIDAEVLPITASGNIKKKAHTKWITFRLAKEEAMRRCLPFDGIECPSVKDVFFRRGGNLATRQGNVILREVLESKYAEYKSRQTQGEKTEISWWVVGEIERRHGRFLIEGPQGWWVELKDRDVAREKVSNAFRDLRKHELHSLATPVLHAQGSLKRKHGDCFCFP